MCAARNIQFTLLIRFGKQLREFNFRQRSPQLFDTDTVDSNGNRYYFKMVQSGDGWAIEGRDLPAWISAGEAAICEALQNKIQVI